MPAPVPESGRQATGPYAPSDQTRSNLYFGPANVTWAGELSVSATSAPVFRYHEPSTAAADQFAASLGATLQFRPAGYLGSYAGHDFTLQVRATVQAPAREPWFSLVASASAQPADGAAPADAAGAFLVAHSLAPAWPNVVTVDAAGDQAKVRYLRRFPVPAYGDAYLVDGEGERYGLEVDLNGGRLALVSGPLPVSLDFADYPIISADQAVRSALASSPAAPGNINPPPAVRLTAAELVYVVVAAGDHTFYEPAFLFSGSFLLGGMTYEKRVLVPAVDPSQRSS
ncbi:hypothetical protein EPN29_12505 [bacterium]|nr:MAG: hypothetical protein EPN29_12505 [bacterium]